MTTPITFAGVNFNTWPEPDADGCWWSMRPPKGWGSPPQQVDIVEPTIAPGGGQAANRRKPWSLVAPLIVRAPTDAAIEKAYERLFEMPGDGLDRSAVLLVGGTIPKWVQVIQTGADIPEPNGLRVIKAELELLALYPFKRGESVRTTTLAAGQTKTLTNAGTRAAFLTFTTTGSGTVQVRQNGSGQVLRTRTSVASGTVFDCYEQSVTTSGGLEVFPMGSPSEWLSIPGGTVDTPAGTSVTNQGTAPLSVAWYDTY